MISHEEDIRWEQRHSNFSKALAKLREGVVQVEQARVNPHTYALLIEGLIQRFEFTHELAWKVIKDYGSYQGEKEIRGPRDATRYGLRTGLIDSETWMEMIHSRNITSHCYDEVKAQKVYHFIIKTYLPLLLQFDEKMRTLHQSSQT